jgi:hypothetical protein
VCDKTAREGRGQRFRDSRCGSPGPFPSRWTQATKEQGTGTPRRVYAVGRLGAKREIPVETIYTKFLTLPVSAHN